MSNNDNTVDAVKQSILKILDNLEMHEKTTIKDLIDKAVAETKVQVSIANGLVPMIVHQHAEEGWGTVEIGRGGGCFRGGKKPRTDPRPRCETCNQVVRAKPVKEV